MYLKCICEYGYTCTCTSIHKQISFWSLIIDLCFHNLLVFIFSLLLFSSEILQYLLFPTWLMLVTRKRRISGIMPWMDGCKCVWTGVHEHFNFQPYMKINSFLEFLCLDSVIFLCASLERFSNFFCSTNIQILTTLCVSFLRFLLHPREETSSYKEQYSPKSCRNESQDWKGTQQHISLTLALFWPLVFTRTSK